LYLLPNQVRDDMRTAGVMPSEELISKPNLGERSPCSFDISQAEREMELWCWAKRHHRQREAAVPEHTLDNCSNYARPTEITNSANYTTTETNYRMPELNVCKIYKRIDKKKDELWNYPAWLLYINMNEVRWFGRLLKISYIIQVTASNNAWNERVNMYRNVKEAVMLCFPVLRRN